MQDRTAPSLSVRKTVATLAIVVFVLGSWVVMEQSSRLVQLAAGAAALAVYVVFWALREPADDRSAQ